MPTPIVTTLLVVLHAGVLAVAPQWVFARMYPISSYALVSDDATLRVEGRTIHLYGIYIPPTNRACRSNVRPIRCGSRAALALDFKIQGFVHCEPKSRNDDGSFNALCRVNRSAFDEGEDLSAYLLSRGWAVALPGAPIEYYAMERIAEKRGVGVWGIPVDVINRPRRDRLR